MIFSGCGICYAFENGRLINHTKTESTNSIVPCHIEIINDKKYVVNYLSGNIVKIDEKW